MQRRMRKLPDGKNTRGSMMFQKSRREKLDKTKVVKSVKYCREENMQVVMEEKSPVFSNKEVIGNFKVTIFNEQNVDCSRLRSGR